MSMISRTINEFYEHHFYIAPFKNKNTDVIDFLGIKFVEQEFFVIQSKKSLWLLSFYLFSMALFSADAANRPEYFMFIGNPGVGKSAIINSLIGKVVAQSGISPGAGLTKFFSSYAHNGKQYFDTPGLADIELREKAAVEIESALKKDGNYRLFFVITLEALRVKPEDITTINTVMAAIKTPDKKFNVIINKVNKKEKASLSTDAKALAAVYAAINSGEHKTNSIWYIDRDRDLEDGDKEFISMDANLNDFVFNKSLAINIAKENVVKIEIDEFEQIKAQFAATVSVLQAQIAEGNKKHDDLIKMVESVQKSLAAVSDELKEAEKKAEKDRDRAVAAEKEAEMERERRIKAENERCKLF